MNSQLDNQGIFHSSARTCINCRSNEFYYNAQSELICRYCGVEIADFVMESQEQAGKDGDGGAITFGTKTKTLKSARPKTEAKSQYQASLLELLSVYQYCLILLVKEATKLLVVEDVDQSVQDVDLHETPNILETLLLTTSQDLWKSFLRGWQTAKCRCQMQGIFNKQLYHNEFCFCTNQTMLEHPPFPTKPLLLGFLYLTLRIAKLDVIGADVIRWCDRGLLPYHNLWQHLLHEPNHECNNNSCLNMSRILVQSR